VSPRPTEEQLVEFYNSTVSFNYSPQKLNRCQSVDLVRTISETIKKYRPNANTLLDVGCSYGHELNGYKSLGFVVSGMDYSRTAAQYAFENYEVRVDIGEWPNDDRTFDVITSRHVIEHIRNLDLFARNLYTKLSPGGVAYIITPNFLSLNSRIFGRYWNAVTPPGHLNYWSPNSIQQYFEMRGFSVLLSKTTSLSYVQTPARGVPGFWIGFLESMVNLLRVRRATKTTHSFMDEADKLVTVNAAISSGTTLPGGKLYYLKKVGYAFAWSLNFLTYPLQLFMERTWPLGEELHIFIAKKG
jgi:SAM-dependent methyltransferase